MSLADQHLESLRAKSSAAKGKARERDEQPKARLGEGEDLAIDQARLKRAREDEKHRRELTDEEAWQRAKKSKTEVTEEDMGGCWGDNADVQRPTDCRNQHTTIRWQITRIQATFDCCTMRCIMRYDDLRKPSVPSE